MRQLGKSRVGMAVLIAIVALLAFASVANASSFTWQGNFKSYLNVREYQATRNGTHHLYPYVSNGSNPSQTTYTIKLYHTYTAWPDTLVHAWYDVPCNSTRHAYWTVNAATYMWKLVKVDNGLYFSASGSCVYP